MMKINVAETLRDMDSKYAPAYRLATDEVRKELNKIVDTAYVHKILDGLPYIAAILNEHRQIVFANNTLLSQFNLKVLDELLGDRPGEVLHCVNSKKEIGGCGTSENCRYCGAVNTILNCQKNNSTYSDECRILSDNEGRIEAYDFKVTSSPFSVSKKNFIIFTLVDISAEKRKMALERIFFHDVINKAGSLQGFFELVKSVDEFDKMKELITIMDEISVELTQEIISQRELVNAENGELKVTISEISTSDIIESSVNQISKHDAARNRIVQIDEKSATLLLNSDEVLLKRILLNMLKNALEASSENEVISIGCRSVHEKASFWVHNPGFIPKSTQLQIFQRSFSTKGKNRGLGTYSMKLLGEHYLHGKVHFNSSEENGTTFFLEIPTQFS